MANDADAADDDDGDDNEDGYGVVEVDFKLRSVLCMQLDGDSCREAATQSCNGINHRIMFVSFFQARIFFFCFKKMLLLSQLR